MEPNAKYFGQKIPDGGIRWSFRGPDISDEFKIGRLHQRQVGRLRIEKVVGFKSEIPGRLNLGAEP